MKELLYPLAIIIVITLAFGYLVLPVIAIIGVLSAFIFRGKLKKAN